MIEVLGLVKRFGDTAALDGVTFRVERGEIVGFLGPNGAGKSTTLRILSTFLTQDAGEAGSPPAHPPLDVVHAVHESLGFCAGLRGVRGRGSRAAGPGVAEGWGLT